jgi:uncharacterized protein (DUF4415 family)
VSKRVLGSNLAKVDATTDEEITQQIADDPDLYPELSEAELARAAWKIGDRVVSEEEGRVVMRRRGRPKSVSPKVHVSLRLDADVVEAFRATGPGWQGRINDVLRQDERYLRRDSDSTFRKTQGCGKSTRSSRKQV